METILPIMNQFSEIETCVEVRLKSVSLFLLRSRLQSDRMIVFSHSHSHWLSYSSAPPRTWKTSRSCSTMHRRPSFTPPRLSMTLKTNRSELGGWWQTRHVCPSLLLNGALFFVAKTPFHSWSRCVSERWAEYFASQTRTTTEHSATTNSTASRCHFK